VKYKRWLTIFSLACLIVIYLLVLIGCAKPSIEDLTYYEPGSQIPRLTEEGKAKAKEIALQDSRVQELIAGKEYVVYREYDYYSDPGIGMFYASDDDLVIGATVTIYFNRPYTIQYDWFMPNYDDNYEYLGEIPIPGEHQTDRLTIFVDFREWKVVGVRPFLE